MTYTDARGHVLNLREETFPTHRMFLWIAYNAACDACWHNGHAAPVQTCLSCFPPQPLELAA